MNCFNCDVELTNVPDGTKEPACCLKCWLEAEFKVMERCLLCKAGTKHFDHYLPEDRQ